MTVRWDSEWDDEEWLKQQSITTLREVYASEPPAGVDKSAIKGKIKELMTTRLQENAAAGFKNEAENNAYDLLSYVKVVDEDALQAEVTDAEGNKHKVKDIVYDVVDSRIRALDGKDDLVSYLQRKALLEAAKTIQKDDADKVRVFDEAIKEEKTKIEYELSQPREEISDNEFAHYDEADRSGALEGISEEAKNAFIDTLARHSGWDKINDTEVVFNDNALASMGVNGLEPYGKDGKLNPVYEQCAELLGKIQFEVPADAKAEDIQSYKQQLLSNAAMRATNEILKDKNFKLRCKTAEEMLDAYKQEVAGQFERGVLLTCLAGHKETATMLENITYNKETQKIESKEGKDGIKNALEDILTGKAKINPAAIAVDTEMLNLENKKISKILKRKRIDENKLTFRQKAKKVFQASWDNIIKKDGYQKILANFATFGASALLISNPATAAVITGAAMYAGWTAVNAWVIPVYDKLNQEMREKGIKGFKNKWKYRINNWKRAKAEKYAEPDFKKRAWLRATEGLIVGGISGGMAGAGTMRMFARQGTMAVGKSTSRIMSLFSRKNATTKFLENPTLENLNALNTAIANEKSDTIALASVVFGAAAADYLAFTETGQEITAAVKEIKIFNREATGIVPKESTTDTPGQTLNNVVEERQSTADSTLNNVVEEQQTTADATRRPAMVDKDGDGIPDYIQRPDDQKDDLPGDSTAAATQNVDRTGAGEVPAGDTTGAGETAAGESGSSDAAAGDGTPVQTAGETPAGETPVENGNGNAAAGDAGNKEDGAGTEGTTDKGDNAGNDGASESEVPPAAEESSFNYSELSENEKRMYLNSVKKWDNNALATRITELEKEGMTITPEIKDALEEGFADNAFGQQLVQSFYDAIEAGKVESLPEGVSAVEYVDKLTRLAQLAPYAQRDAISIMVKDLLCEDFHPTDSEVALVKTALDSIVYEKGSMECIIPDANGNLCVKTTSMFGQYVGPQQMAQVEVNGEMKELPLRTANVTTGLEAKVNCDEGTGRIVSTYERHTLKDCGCIKTPEHTSVLETRLQDSELLKPLPEIIAEAETNPDTRQEITLNFKDPYSEATATYAAGKDNFAVEQTTADGDVKYLRMEKDGTLHLWQDNVDLNADHRLGTSGIEVEHHIPLSLNMNNLGAAKITDLENVTTYQYGEGKNALVFTIDKESGIVTTTIGKQEVILDQKTAQAALANIQKAAEEGGVDKVYNYKSGDEAEQTSAVAEHADKVKKAKIEENLNNRVDQAVEKASLDKTEVTYEDRQAAVAAKIAEIRAGQAENTVAGETAGSFDNGIEPETKTAATTTEQEGVEVEHTGEQPSAKSQEPAAAPVAAEQSTAAAEQSTESFIGGDGTVVIDMKDPAITENFEHFKEQGVSDETLAVNLAVKEREYQLLQEKAANGEALNNVEQRRIAEYEKLLQEQKLTHVGESKAPDVPETTEKSQETSVEKTAEQTEKTDAQTSIRESINQTMKEFTDVQNHYQQALKIGMNDRGQYTLNGVAQGSLDVAVSEQQTLPSFLAQEELFARQMDTKLEKGISLSEAETKRLSTYDQYLKRYNLDRAPAEEGGSGRNQENNLGKPKNTADLKALRGIAQDGKSAGVPKSQSTSNTISAGMPRNLKNNGR